MKTKNAFIISVSVGFSIGAFALIEAMKKYGHTEDLHILYWDDLKQKKYKYILDKLETLKNSSSSNIYLKPIKTLRGAKEPCRGRDCRYYAYPYMLSMDYDTYCIWQGDLLLLNNISKYLEIAKKFTILSNNYNYKTAKYQIKQGRHLKSKLANPICNIPFITSDRKLLKKIWEKSNEKGGDMKTIYNSLIDLNKFKNVFLVPYNYWVYDWHFREPIKEHKGKYYKADGSEMNAYHGPFWDNWGFNPKRFSQETMKKHKMFQDIYKEVVKKYDLWEISHLNKNS